MSVAGMPVREFEIVSFYRLSMLVVVTSTSRWSVSFPQRRPHCNSNNEVRSHALRAQQGILLYEAAVARIPSA